MQFSANTELATYLAGTHVVFIHELKADWNRNWLFDHPYSDLSKLFDEIVIKRSRSGVIPDDLNVTEGYGIAEMTISLSGKTEGNTLDLDELLQPWNTASSLYGDDVSNTLVTYKITVPLSTSSVTITQFVGLIRSADPELDGSVTITVLDLLSLLQTPVVLRPIAIDNQYMVFNTFGDDKQKFNLTWVIDQILRQCGLYQSPAPMLASATIVPYACFTLNGSWFPESYSAVNYVGIDTTVQSPDPFYISGQYGYAANGTPSSYGQYRYTVDPKATWVKGETHQTGAWVKLVSQIASGTFTVVSCLALSGDLDIAGRCQIELRVSTAGVITVNLVQLTGQSYNVTFTGPTISTFDAWHYVGIGLTWRTSDSGVTATFNLDGAITTATSGTILLAFTALQNYSTVRLQSKMPVQSVQWWKTISGSLTWPKDPPNRYGLAVQANLDLALSYITLIPDIFYSTGSELIGQILSAELGSLTTNETGEVRLLNRESLRLTYSDANTVYLDNNTLSTMKVNRRTDSFANFIDTGASLYALINSTVYTSTVAQTFDTPPLTTRSVIVALSDTYRITSVFPAFTNPWNANVLSGFHVTKITDGTIPAGVNVSVTLIDQRTLQVNVLNSSVDYVRLATADGTPALRVSGYKVTKLNERGITLSDSSSISELGITKSQQIGNNVWGTYELSVRAVALSLLNDVSFPVPLIDPVTVNCDPRIQLGDVVISQTSRVGKIVASIIEYTRTIRQGERPLDTWILRALSPPGYWLLGEPGLSEIGDTTVLY